MSQSRRVILVLVVLAAVVIYFRTREAPKAESTAQHQPSSPKKSLEKSGGKPIPQLEPAILDTRGVPGKLQSNSDQRVAECWKKYEAEMTSKNNLPTGKDFDSRLPVGDWILKKGPLPGEPSPNQSRGDLLLLALAHGGTLSGNQNEGKNPKLALKILEDLSSADPRNSAPILLAAGILLKNGEKTEALELVRQAEQNTSRFDSYLMETTRAILLEAETPYEMVRAIEIVSAMPIADYGQLRELLKETKAVQIAEQMMANGSNERNAIELVEWIPIEYMIGHRAVEEIRGPAGLPNRKELWDKKRKAVDALGLDQAINDFEKECTIETLGEFMQIYQRNIRFR